MTGFSFLLAVYFFLYGLSIHREDTEIRGRLAQVETQLLTSLTTVDQVALDTARNAPRVTLIPGSYCFARNDTDPPLLGVAGLLLLSPEGRFDLVLYAEAQRFHQRFYKWLDALYTVPGYQYDEVYIGEYIVEGAVLTLYPNQPTQKRTSMDTPHRLILQDVLSTSFGTPTRTGAVERWKAGTTNVINWEWSSLRINPDVIACDYHPLTKGSL